MRAAAVAAAVFAAFIGVMYLRFSGDTVPIPEPTPSPAPISVAERCEGYSRVPKPPQCGTPTGPLWWAVPTVPPTPPLAPPVPDALREVGIDSLEFGPEMELPSDIALIIPPNCGNCTGPAGGLSRVYRDANGQIRTDTLLTYEALGLAPVSNPDPNGAYFTGFAADADGSTIAVSVCKRGPCFEGPGRPTPAGADGAIFLSDDGGISWSELDAPDAVLSVSGILPEGKVLVAEPSDKPEPPVYRILPGGEVLMPPVSGYALPLTLPNGEIFWSTANEGILRSEGSRWLGAWADPSHLAFTSKFVFDANRERGLVPASVLPDTGPGSRLLIEFRSDGSLERVFSVPGSISPSAWLDNRRVLATASACDEQYSFCAGSRPAIVDLESGLINPIQSSFGPDVVNYIPAVQQGPFARVVNTEGTCLYIRPQVGGGAPLGCAAEGVLLRLLGGEASLDGVHWLAVTTPAGVEGWASTQYLER